MKRTLSWFLVVALAAVQFGSFSLARAETLPIVISAVQITAGTGKTSYDFVELFNPNEQPISLEGYSLVKRTASGSTDSLLFSWSSTGALIPAQSFYLWANETFVDLTSTPDVISSGTIANDNGVALRFGDLDAGELVSAISWGTANNSFAKATTQNPTASKSISLKNLFDITEGYEIRDSSPRNSSVAWTEVDPEPEPLIDNAQCISNTFPAEITVGSAVSADVTVRNVGTSTWLVGEGGYGLKFSELEPTVPINGSVLPNQDMTFSVTTTNFNQAGSYSLEWQMKASESISFGPLCSHTLIVTQQDNPPTDNIDHDLVKITEIYANPIGTDSGKEVIELYNGNDEEINIKNWLLDDINSSDVLSSNVYQIESDTIIPAKGYKAITIPSGKFALNNTGQEYASLLDNNNEFIDTLSYSVSIPENKSYALIASQWYLNSPSLGAVNVKDSTPEDETDNEEEGSEEDNPEEEPDETPLTLMISEIYAFPDNKVYKDEFIELYNFGTEPVSLKNFTVQVGDKTKQLPDENLLPGKFVTIAKNLLPAQLRNTGQVVKILTGNNIVIDEVEYPKSEKGMSYSTNLEGQYSWSTVITPGAVNEIVAKPVPPRKPAPPIKQTSASARSKSASATSTTAKAKPSTPISKPASSSTENQQEANVQLDAKSNKNNSNGVAGLVLAGLTTVAGAMFALYRSQIW